MEKPNYIYLLQEREFINSKQNIYKIGKTTQPNLKRMNQYSKGSRLLLQSICSDCHIIEKELIKLYKDNFNRDYEYIGLNSKSIEHENEGSAYVFNDGTKPFDDKNNFIKFCSEYKRIVNDNLLTHCLNTNHFSKMILSLLD